VCGRSLAEQLLRRARDRLDALAGSEPDREVRFRVDGKRRVAQSRLAAQDAVDVDGRLGRRPQVILGRAPVVIRTRTRFREDRLAVA
jgi:hypothetical protein